MSYFSVSDCQEYGTLRTDRTVTIRGHDKNESNPIGTSRIDLISFLSVIMKSNSATAEEKTTMRLLSMHLGSWNMFCKLDMRHGASFSVTLIPRRQLLSKTFVSLGNDNLKTSLFALKTPRLDMGLSSPRNSLLFRSIATEYQILKCKSLKQHDNIITLFGCCWQSLDIYASQPIPSLILEGTQLGDLATFSRSHELTLRERLRLCIHITSGLKAIHSLGIIHGDIKLENVLVFDSNRGYTAKVADFGSALVLSEIELPSRRPLGTILYSPPECFEAGATFGRDEFFRIDIFSLGITLSALLQGDHVLENMKQLGSQLTSLKKDGQLSDWILSVDCDGSVIAEHDDTWEPDATWPIDSVQTDGIIWEKYILLIRGTLAALSNERFGSTDEVLPILRSMLRLQLQNTPQLRNDRGKKRSKSSAVKDTLERWARMSAILGVKKARLAKISGANIQSSTRLHHDEFDAITLSCYPKFCPVDVIRASRLVQKYRAYRKQQTLLSSRWRLIARLPSKRREQGQARNTEIRKAYQYVLKRMKQTLGEWVLGELLKPTDLIINNIEKVKFEGVITGIFFDLLPQCVRNMVEQQLLQRASGCLGSEIDRDAAYAYAFMTINSKELPVSRLDEALELLVQSAKRGHVGARCSFGTLCDAFDYKNPVPHEEEVEWVSECSQLGSMSALRRLRILEPSKFKEVTQRIRYEHGGLCPELTKFLLWNCRLDIESGKPRGIVSGRIHYLAITGDIGALQNYPRPPDGNYDLPNTIGETPLLVACRAGHTAVAKFLLYSGSDPSICATTGATALHFLSSFNDKHIPGMASLLLQHGAKIDQLSHNTSIYKELFDSPFGITEGTPLLWAVAAGNLCAAKTLVDRGADPLKRRIKTSHEDEQYAVGLSSMAYAVKFHQYQMITILLSSARTAAKYKALQHRLNTTFEIVPAERYTALYAAVDCDAAVRFREYLIHGKDFWDATQRSVQLLIEFGVDPKISPPASDGNPSNPIIHAAYSGSLPTMKYLWNYKDGLLRPTPTEWHKALQTAVGMSLHSMFDFLVAHRADITPNKNIDQLAIENLMTITNDQHFVMGSLELIPEVASTSWMNVEKSVFETAIATEQFKAAESLYYRGNLDLTSRYEGRTLLGKFIMGSSELNNVDKKIEFLLSIHGKKDILYWDVDYLERSGLTALQAALCAPTTTGHTQLDVFSTVLKHFNDPEYLNAQIRGLSNHKYTGYSALHLAAYKGRLEAITELLEQPGIDKNLKNCRGETAADMCIIQEIRSIRAYECCNSILPTQSRTPLTEKPSTNLMIFYHLIRVGAQISKFSVMLRRTSQDKFDLIDREMGPVQNIPLSRALNEIRPPMRESSQSIILKLQVGGIATVSDTPLKSEKKFLGDLRRLFPLLRSRYSQAG